MFGREREERDNLHHLLEPSIYYDLSQGYAILQRGAASWHSDTNLPNPTDSKTLSGKDQAQPLVLCCCCMWLLSKYNNQSLVSMKKDNSSSGDQWKILSPKVHSPLWKYTQNIHKCMTEKQITKPKGIELVVTPWEERQCLLDEALFTAIRL